MSENNTPLVVDVKEKIKADVANRPETEKEIEKEGETKEQEGKAKTIKSLSPYTKQEIQSFRVRKICEVINELFRL